MKTTLMYIGAILATILMLFVILFSFRYFSNATTPVVLHQPKPGVTCATMVTADGAAISCWKD